MPKVILSGLNDMNFETKTGEVIDGVKLHFLVVDPNVFGKAAENQFVRRDIFDNFGIAFNELKEILGTEVTLDFNTKGKVIGLAI